MRRRFWSRKESPTELPGRISREGRRYWSHWATRSTLASPSSSLGILFQVRENVKYVHILTFLADMFADHIGNLTVELVLASAEVRNSFSYHLFSLFYCLKVTTLVRRRHPSLNTLNLLLEVQPFPGLEPESKISQSHQLSSMILSFIIKIFMLN